MDKIVYLAVAGSGKTYTLCNSLDNNQRNIIIAYTNQNLYNIRREIIHKFGKIPEDTYITTFHGFVYNFFILPYETRIHEVNTKGITFSEPPKPRIKGTYNPWYIKDDQIGHYLCMYNRQYFCGRMSKLVIKCGKNKDSILIKGIRRLELFFDNLYIDEFQDFRKDDYGLLNEIMKRINISCYLYGDYYQHSVSAINNSGKPFKNTSYVEFVAKLKKEGFSVDDRSLVASRRCSKEVCNFVKEKLDINIVSSKRNHGDIIFVADEMKIKEIINDDNIVKLVHCNAKKQQCNAINWSYSKGDTYDETCVILNKNLSKLNDQNYKFSGTDIAKNNLYVALTRSKGSVYLVHKEDFEKH